jgi:hypothetical protein
MVDMLYKVLSRDDLKNIYTGKSAVLFMVKHSFISKLHNYCQEFQTVLIIVTQFFLDHVSHHHGDAKYWMKVIFQPCLRHKDFLQFCQNCLMLFDKEFGILGNYSQENNLCKCSASAQSEFTFHQNLIVSTGWWKLKIVSTKIC